MRRVRVSCGAHPSHLTSVLRTLDQFVAVAIVADVACH